MPRQDAGLIMIRVRLEIWMQLENLGKDFHSTSGVCATREEQIEEGITVRDLFDRLAERYQPFREKIFQRGKGVFYPEIVVTVNDRIISPDEICPKVLEDGDKITVLPMFGGG
jgi:molybdopterin converting factor small subunit